MAHSPPFFFILPLLLFCYHTNYISVHGMPTPTDLSLLLYAVILFYLAAPGLSCGVRELPLPRMYSLVAACGLTSSGAWSQLLCSAWGPSSPTRGQTYVRWISKRLSTTGSPGKSLQWFFLDQVKKKWELPAEVDLCCPFYVYLYSFFHHFLYFTMQIWVIVLSSLPDGHSFLQSV